MTSTGEKMNIKEIVNNFSLESSGIQNAIKILIPWFKMMLIVYPYSILEDRLEMWFKKAVKTGEVDPYIGSLIIILLEAAILGILQFAVNNLLAFREDYRLLTIIGLYILFILAMAEHFFGVRKSESQEMNKGRWFRTGDPYKENESWFTNTEFNPYIGTLIIICVFTAAFLVLLYWNGTDLNNSKFVPLIMLFILLNIWGEIYKKRENSTYDSEVTCEQENAEKKIAEEESPERKKRKKIIKYVLIGLGILFYGLLWMRIFQVLK